MTFEMPDIQKIAPPEGAIIFYYSGWFAQSIIQASADAIRLRLETAHEDTRRRRRLISAFIELAQNIVHYSADCLTDPDAVTDEVRFGKLKVVQTPIGFTLTCCNPVTRAVAERLEAKLRLLVKMSLDEIRESYRAALRGESEADSKGGGIGLLTLARESVEPLKFSFDDVAGNADHKMFNLTVTV
jgi:hypothetical protein